MKDNKTNRAMLTTSSDNNNKNNDDDEDDDDNADDDSISSVRACSTHTKEARRLVLGDVHRRQDPGRALHVE
jgi:hypothetical protein